MGKKLSFLFGFLLCLSLEAYDPNENLTKENKLPKVLENIGFSDITGRLIQLSVPFRDETGKELSLESLFSKGKPVILSLVYFKCPTLCNYHMNGVVSTLKKMDKIAGKDYEYVAISIEPKETAEIALPKRDAYWKDYGKSKEPIGFHFLTGTELSIQSLTREMEFRYAWDDSAQQYIHASGIYVFTPEGKVSRIFQGIQFSDRDLQLALVEASNGKIGTFVDKFALFCFQFDPHKNKYTIYAFRMMQLGAGLTLLILGSFLFVNWRKTLKNNGQGVT